MAGPGKVLIAVADNTGDLFDENLRFHDRPRIHGRACPKSGASLAIAGPNKLDSTFSAAARDGHDTMHIK